MPHFLVGELGPRRPLPLKMLFDATEYTSVVLKVDRPAGEPPAVWVPTTVTPTLLTYAPVAGDLPVPGIYRVLVVCTDASNDRRAKFEFTVG